MKIFKDEATLGVAILNGWREKKRLLKIESRCATEGELSIFYIVREQMLSRVSVLVSCSRNMLLKNDVQILGCGILGFVQSVRRKRKTAETKTRFRFWQLRSRAKREEKNHQKQKRVFSDDVKSQVYLSGRSRSLGHTSTAENIFGTEAFPITSYQWGLVRFNVVCRSRQRQQLVI